MKKKIFILSILFINISLITLFVFSKFKTIKAKDNEVQKVLSSDITPLKPGLGETISVLPNALSDFWNLDDLVNTYNEKREVIGELTPYNSDMASFVNYFGNTDTEKEKRRSLYNKYDLFSPVNNTLAWNSEVDAKEYRVIISRDKDLSTIEREYKVSGDKNSVIFNNPYTGVTYYWQVIASKEDNSKVYSDVFYFNTGAYPRTISIDGVSNTRDLGGNIGLDGKRVKEGLVYRGANLEAITEGGINEFKNELKIKTEVDLRGAGEGIENYLSLPSYYHYPSPYDYTNNSNSESGIETTGDKSLVKNFGNAVKVFANENNYPIYFHCSVGRDRTGWMGLCLNFLLGVSEEVALKEFSLSLFSTTGAYEKGTTVFYDRYIRIRDYINTFSGNNLSEKMESYLVEKAGVTHEDCEKIRGILLGDIETGFDSSKENTDSLSNLFKVTYRIYGEKSIIEMVSPGALLNDPNISEGGVWYHNDTPWNFDSDTVNEDIYLDYIKKDTCNVFISYNGIDLQGEVIDVPYNTSLDFSIFNKEGYTFKVYDDDYNELSSLLVKDDIRINVIYKSDSGFIPRGNSRVIVMAGQSNGAGVGHYEYLEESLDQDKIDEINGGYSNVLMAGFSHDIFYNEFEPVYASKDSAQSQTPGTFGFEVGLADRLSKAFPDETIYIVKYAFGGASLNYDWISPSSDCDMVMLNYDPSRGRGWLYTGLEECLTTLLNKLEETTNTHPVIEAFMWMQGESDATAEAPFNLYLQSFNNLIDDFKSTFKDYLSYKFKVYDAGICETSVWNLAKQMNNLKRERCAEFNDVYIDTVSRLTTSYEPYGFYTDNAHYDAACYIDLGHMFADAFLENTVSGYHQNSLEIENPGKITLTLGENYTIDTPQVFFNGTQVEAKMSYFSEQHKGLGDSVYSFFKVDGDTFIPTKVGTSSLRITAYYSDEVRTIIIPIEVVE